MPKTDRKHRHQSPAPEPSSGRGRQKLWLAMIVLGVVLRLIVAAVSIGSNDAASWLRFGDEINQNGLFHTYFTDPDFNHPPIPGYWAAICAKLAGNDDAPWHDSIFTNLFKLAPIAGDCLGIYLLYRIWSRARSKREPAESDTRLLRARLFTDNRTHALFIAAMYALSIDAIAVSGYHCNTCLLYTSPSPRDGLLSRMPSSA